MVLLNRKLQNSELLLLYFGGTSQIVLVASAPVSAEDFYFYLYGKLSGICGEVGMRACLLLLRIG
jgi:hypothetical protein